MLPEGFTYAYPTGRDVPCVRREGADRMLCGARFERPAQAHGFAAEVTQPAGPGRVCAACLGVLVGLPGLHPRAAEYGCCPVCHGDIPLAGGRIGEHGAWVVGRHGPRVTSAPCDGAGMAPEVDG